MKLPLCFAKGLLNISVAYILLKINTKYYKIMSTYSYFSIYT